MGVSLKKYIIITSTLLLAACTSEQTPLAAPKTLQPENYKQKVIQHVRQNYFDPYTVRDASISKPFAVNRIGHGEVWFVCVRSNAKNRMGGYTGIKPTAYWFRNGEIAPTSNESSQYDDFNCAYAQYSPFPEIENMK